MLKEKVKLKLSFLEKVLVKMGIKKYGYTQFRVFIKKNERLNSTQKYLIFKYVNDLEEKRFNLV